MSLSLFSRAMLTLIGTFGLFAFLAFLVVVEFALVPVADRATRDLSSLMLMAAETMTHLDPSAQVAFREAFVQDQGLRLLAPNQEPQDLTDYFFPYMERLRKVLDERIGTPVRTGSNLEQGDRWFWVQLSTQSGYIWVGFPRDRVQSRPLEGVILVVFLSIVLVVISAGILARRVTIPLERLSAAAEQVALGISPRPLAETGPRELANLARQFNEMSRQVRELLANRTLLLAGISHDLRTPLTRLRLALEMLPPNPDQMDLIQRMEGDLEEMNGLITQAGELGRSLGRGEPNWIDLDKLIGDLCQDNQRLKWQGGKACPQRLDPLALRRILGNLLENALRYSQDEVEVRLLCKPVPEIQILDRGPGIPEHERAAVFRPFYRLEQSRNRATGGSGLGLAISQQLAKANGFALHLEPRAAGGVIARLRLGGEGPLLSG